MTAVQETAQPSDITSGRPVLCVTCSCCMASFPLMSTLPGLLSWGSSPAQRVREAHPDGLAHARSAGGGRLAGSEIASARLEQRPAGRGTGLQLAQVNHLSQGVTV